MMNLTLKQLRYFEALARHGHFGRAADVCAISQPALSMQIKELEETLGTELFERGARQVRLTNFGEAFALRARDILRSVDELEDLARASQDRLVGRLRVGIIPTVAPYLLPTIIGKLTGMHDGLDIHVRESLTSKLVQELTEGRLDTAIVALPVSEPSLTEVALFSENFVLVRPDEDREKPVPNREALREMRLLLLEEGHCFRVTLIPEMAVSVETRSASVSIARFQSPQPSRTIGMIWRKTSPLAKQLLQIAEVVRQSADTMREQHMPAPWLREAGASDKAPGSGSR
jgi:LysR family hydrogen peroxide-inducible transcriptional activator